SLSRSTLHVRMTAAASGSSMSASTDGSQDSKPTAGFQRTIQRATIHVRSSGRDEVTGAHVLVAVFAERESHAAYFLQEQEMTRYNAVNYISHGIAKRPGPAESRSTLDEEERPVPTESRSTLV